MKLPERVRQAVFDEACKHARFNWHQGWEKSSGYIKTELRGDSRYGGCRIYIKWEKKKPPTDDQIKTEISNHIDRLLGNEEHHSDQKDFSHYLLCEFYHDIHQARHHAMLTIVDCLPRIIEILEKSDDFPEPVIQGLHNELKNLDCVISNHEAITQFLEHGRKRVGES